MPGGSLALLASVAEQFPAAARGSASPSRWLSAATSSVPPRLHLITAVCPGCHVNTYSISPLPSLCSLLPSSPSLSALARAATRAAGDGGSRGPPRPTSAVGDGGVRLRPSCRDRLDDTAIKSKPSGIGDGSTRLRLAGEVEEVCADALALLVDVATDDEVRTTHQFVCLVVVEARHSGRGLADKRREAGGAAPPPEAAADDEVDRR
uniref:Uncharacterized protein n=1 Tax=Oryza sativa subsp. japonica TaxID=39947 RepID=Q651H8_ORYSJ|nr:hypothetical protein [Oryza sativa Japonica Group]